MVEIRALHARGNFDKIIPVRLRTHTDLMNGIKKACEDNGIRQGVVLTGIGSVRKLTIQVLTPNEKAKVGAAYTEPQTIPGPVEVLSIQGCIFQTEEGEVVLHLHGTFSDKEGKVYGGHLVPGENPVLATVEAVIAEITGARLIRRYDEDVGLKLITPEPL